jgi:hypothetical protein
LSAASEYIPISQRKSLAEYLLTTTPLFKVDPAQPTVSQAGDYADWTTFRLFDPTDLFWKEVVGEHVIDYRVYYKGYGVMSRLLRLFGFHDYRKVNEENLQKQIRQTTKIYLVVLGIVELLLYFLLAERSSWGFLIILLIWMGYRIYMEKIRQNKRLLVGNLFLTFHKVLLGIVFLFMTLRTVFIWARPDYESIHDQCDLQGTDTVKVDDVPFMCLSNTKYNCDIYEKDYFYQDCNNTDRAFLAIGFVSWVVFVISHKVYLYMITCVTGASARRIEDYIAIYLEILYLNKGALLNGVVKSESMWVETSLKTIREFEAAVKDLQPRQLKTISHWVRSTDFRAQRR